MKSVALCIQIHIPVVYHKHPFSRLKTTDKFLNEKLTRSHVQLLAEDKLLPFLHSVGNLMSHMGDRFRFIMSISGSSLRLLEKYAPHIIDEIRILSESGTAEFVAEPWSNSILPWFIHNELKLQTNLHRNTIKAIFGKLPRVFMADLPLNASNYKEFNPFPECQLTLTCSNHLRKTTGDDATLIGKKSQFLIHHTLSQKLQQLASDNYKTAASKPITPFLRYLRKHSSLVRPLIVVFNPLAENISSFNKWEQTIELLLEKTKSSFYSLSDLEETATYFSIDNNYSEDLLEQFNTPDSWLKNNMQKEAFNQLKNIYKIIHTTNNSYLPEAWEYLQDLNSFLYMSDSFFLKEFSDQNYSPWLSPHEAFTSYMNAVASFWTGSANRPKPIVKTHFYISPAIN